MKRVFFTVASPFVIYGSLHNRRPAFSHADSLDPLSCKHVACASKLEMFEKSMRGFKTNASSNGKDAKGEASQEQPKSSSEVKAPKEPDISLEAKAPIQTVSDEGCPIDRAELGASTWKLIHTMAANFPDNPSDQEQQHAINFMEALSLLYPCKICAADFKESIRENPPKVSSREEFVLWCCRVHNEVNTKLGYETVPCSVKTLDEKWRTGRSGCWNWTEENE